MIIVVEGIDRVGKTTLCNKLSKELNIPIYKHDIKVCDYDKMDNINETDKMLQLLDMVDLLDGDIIFDRLHFSESAYGIVERHYDVTAAYDNFKLIDDRLSKLNALLVFVHPTDVYRSSKEHGLDLTQHLSYMEDCLTKSNLTIIGCTYLTIDDAVKEICNEYRI